MNAIVPVSNSNVEIYRASTDAADLCRAIVLQTAMEIQKRKYVKVEGWQAIAIAHGCAASAREVERIDGGVRAIGEVRRMSDGTLIAQAEGFVGEDEPTWFGGMTRKWKWGEKRGEKVWYDEEMPKRPDYAIRAMAQTRAVSRACRSAFAHVVVMIDANLSTTPAEEVPAGGFDNEPIDARAVDVTTTKPSKETLFITGAESAFVMAEDRKTLKAWLKDNQPAVSELTEAGQARITRSFNQRWDALGEPPPSTQSMAETNSFGVSDDEIPY